MNACMEAEMDGDIDGWVGEAPLDTYKAPPSNALSKDLPVKGSLEGS